MLVRCPDCRTEYDVAPEDPLPAGTRVRCPRCRAVFALPAAIPARSRVPVPGRDDAPEPVAVHEGPPPAAARPRARILDPVLARRLARAMVSEIVLHRRGERDEALEAGNVLTRFGPAIAAAYRLYGEKVAPELPASRRIFRDAVNDILGGGRTIL